MTNKYTMFMEELREIAEEYRMSMMTHTGHLLDDLTDVKEAFCELSIKVSKEINDLHEPLEDCSNWIATINKVLDLVRKIQDDGGD